MSKMKNFMHECEEIAKDLDTSPQFVEDTIVVFFNTGERSPANLENNDG